MADVIGALRDTPREEWAQAFAEDPSLADAVLANVDALIADMDRSWREARQAERMFKAAVFAQPASEITLWPVHLEASLDLERYDDPLNKCVRFRASLGSNREERA